MLKKSVLSFVFITLFLAGHAGGSVGPIRIHHHIDFDWKFYKGDIEDANSIDFDDKQWQTVDLPHDWMVDGPILEDNPSGAAGGFFPGDIGWYRKTLTFSPEQKDKKVYICFDGIYRNSEVWINGKHIGGRVYGYISHYYDITPYVNFEIDNVIAVRVDGSVQPIDRWYSGCGIYRHVWLTIAEKLHIPVWGTYIITPIIDSASAFVKIQTSIQNDYTSERNCRLMTRILDPSGREIDELIDEREIEAGKLEIFEQQTLVKKPKLWGPDSPVLYKAVFYVYSGNKLVDTYETTFGIRRIEFDHQFGFELNHKKLILKGVCLHHDGGSIGAAVPDGVWERRLKILKEMGVNSVRLAHNPHAPEILDMCDRLGILVFDELYDKWVMPWQDEDKWTQEQIDDYKKNFEANWEQDFTDFINRDKNHPCVFIWSTGNETMEQLRDPNEAIRQLKRYVDKCHELDPSRAVTVALHPNGTNRSDMIHNVDVVSYNYRTSDFNGWHEMFPTYKWIASETKAYRNTVPEDWSKIDWSQNSWFHMDEFVVGQYIWAGIDYLGESRYWPDKGLRGGILYSNGFQKPYSSFTRSIYSQEPMVRIIAFDDVLLNKLETDKETWQESWYGPPVSDHWNYPERTGKYIEVFAHTNCESVELIVNKKSYGEKKLADFPDRMIRWEIPYEEGTVVAVGRNGKKKVCRDELKTAGEPVRIVMSPDRNKMSADGKEIVNIEVVITDKKGVRVPRSTNEISFDVQGAGRLVGIDNGDMSDHSKSTDPQRQVRDGRLLLIVQAARERGDIVITAESEGLTSKPLKIRVR